MSRLDAPLSTTINNAITNKVFPGAVLLVAKGEQLLFHDAYGKADIFVNRPIQRNSIFDLASLTKPFATALAIARLVEQNKIGFDQPVSDILSGFKHTDKKTLTIDMCLRHTTGLPPYKEYYHELVTLTGNRKERLMDLIINEPLIHSPGKTQDYSDMGFMILGKIVEQITGQPIDQYVKETIYSPLKLDALFYIPLDEKEAIMGQYGERVVSTQDCPWRKKLLYGETDDDNTWAVGGVDGHAGLFGDAWSVYILCVSLLKGLNNQTNPLIKPDILNKMVQHKDDFDMVAGFDTPAKINSSAGDYFSPRSIGHLGFTGTSFWIDPETDLIVVLLTNRVHPSRENEEIKKFRPILHNLVCEHFLR